MAVCCRFPEIDCGSLCVEKTLNIRQEFVGVLAVGAKANDVAVFVHEVLEEVPLDFVVGALLLQVSVKVADSIALDINLAKKGELDSELLVDPVLDLLFLPGLLRAELVAGAGQNSEASRTVSSVHGLIRLVVRLGYSSLRGNVDDENRLRIGCEVADGDGRLLRDAADHDVEER